MRRVGALLLLVSLLVLPGCFGLFNPPTTATLEGTVRIDAPAPTVSASSVSPMARSGRSFVFPAGARIVSPSISVTQAPPPDPGPVELLLYSDLLEDEVRDLASKIGFEYLRDSGRGYHVLRDRMGRPADRAMADLRRAVPGAFVEWNRPVYPLALPNDPFLDLQWALEQINAAAAWEAFDWGDEEVIVAIVDAGIDFGHPDLNHGSLWIQGWDFASSSPGGTSYEFNPSDTLRAHDHGTMVAGIIAALTNNGVGVAGTAGSGAKVKLMPVRVFDDGATTRQETIARAIEWAVKNGADVINLSLGDRNCENKYTCDQPVTVLSQALEKARREGVVVVAAAGNHSGNAGRAVLAPANHPAAIAVSAVTVDAEVASYSAIGEEIELAAPGGQAGVACETGIISLRIRNTGHIAQSYGCDSYGTSLAAPHVSGVVALMIARARALGLDYGADDFRQILQITATDLGPTGWDEETGYGLVNAYGAVTAGVPDIFVGSETGSTIEVAGAPVRSKLGGVYRLTGVPEGMWNLYAWVDANQSGTVDAGDYFARRDHVVAQKGKRETGLNLVLSRYEGDELTVNR